MGTITPVPSQIKIGAMKKGHKIVWETLTTTNPTGIGIRNPIEGDKTVQVTGNFAGSASLGIQGSNDSTDGADGVWFSLEGPGDSALAFTAAGGDVIKENPAWIRPNMSSGNGSSDLDVTIVSRP
jgi:hypothetical protein